MKKIVLIAFITLIGLTAWSQDAKNATVVIQTNGVCKMCHDLMQKNVPFFKGVTDFSYDDASSKVTVVYNPQKTNPDEIRLEISKLGYNADQVKADPEARAKLPACCRAEKNTHSGCSHQKSGTGCGGHQK